MMGKRKKKKDEDLEAAEGAGAATDCAADDAARGEADADDEPEEDELTRVIREREEFRDQLQRARADYQNQQHRLPKLIDEGLRNRLEPLLFDLLEVHDYLEMALASPTESPDAKNLAVGVEMVRKRLLDALGHHGVEPVETASGAAFDPTWHEAVATVPADASAAPGTVVDVAKRGFSWKERVLRHAQVRVAEDASAGDAADTEA